MPRTVSRSGITGHFISHASAGRHPRTSVSQTVPRQAGGPTNRSTITGRFVSNATVRRHPNTTIREGQ